MALINCPECKKEISERAFLCPNCGFPIKKPKPLSNKLKYKRPANSNLPDAFYEELALIVKTLGLISAVRFYNESTGKGLKESKDCVDQFTRMNRIAPKKKPGGCILITILAIVGIAAIAWYFLRS